MLELELELLTAERRGRAAVAQLSPGAGESWTLELAADAAGAAWMCAARWAQRFGAEVSIRLPEEDAAFTAPAGWRTLLESSRLQTMVAESFPSEASQSRVRVFHNGETRTYVEIPEEDAAWRLTLAESELFVRPAAPTDCLYTAAESRQVDQRAIGDYQIPGISLMENAALDAAALALDMLPERGRVVVAAGGGNNGGDGLALARGLAGIGHRVDVALLKSSALLTGDAAVNMEFAQGVPGVTMHYAENLPEVLPHLLDSADLAVDALLGTGFKGEVTGVFAHAIERLNAAGVPVLALDLPSGLSADDGVSGPAVRARRTVTFAGVKRGLLAESAREYVGELYLGEIGVPKECLEQKVV